MKPHPALVVFSGQGNHPLARFLRKGFKHCFVVVKVGECYIRVDNMVGRPVLDVVCSSDYDLAGFYRDEGYIVKETQQEDRLGLWPFVERNCVGLVKAILGLSAPFIITPYRLYRRICGFGLLPGKSNISPPKVLSSIGSVFKAPKKPNLAPLPEPAPPPPERDDPAVLQAAQTARIAELKRRGRASSFLTAGGRGVSDPVPLGRPGATAGEQTLGA